MNLTGALSIANGGIANINAQLALVSQNVANASTPGYAVEESTQQSINGDGIGLGVHIGPAQRQIDQALNDSTEPAECHRERADGPANRIAVA